MKKDIIAIGGIRDRRYHYPKGFIDKRTGKPKTGDGFIALASYSTPHGVIRLASPINNEEYARVLYQALRLADSKKLGKVFVVLPTGDDIAAAICDRLQKAAT